MKGIEMQLFMVRFLHKLEEKSVMTEKIFLGEDLETTAKFAYKTFPKRDKLAYLYIADSNVNLNSTETQHVVFEEGKVQFFWRDTEQTKNIRNPRFLKELK